MNEREGSMRERERMRTGGFRETDRKKGRQEIERGWNGREG